MVLLSQTIGLQHIGLNMEAWVRGLVPGNSAVQVGGQDITASTWLHLPGLAGEAMHVQDWPWSTPAWLSSDDCRGLATTSSLVWYRTQISVDLQADPAGRFGLDLVSMSKGVAWVNGHSLGRYWLKIASTDVGAGDCSPCDYRGSYGYGKCSTRCNEPSQRYWHVPRAFLQQGVNQITLLEENPLTDADAPDRVVLLRMNDDSFVL